jgi:Domain of unknown function (DUF4352)
MTGRRMILRLDRSRRSDDFLPWTPVLGVLVLFLVIIGACVGGLYGISKLLFDGTEPIGNRCALGAPNPAPDPAPHADVGINQPVMEGDLEFTVTSIQHGIRSVDSTSPNPRASGQLVLVSITVQNLGDEPVIFYSGNQFAIDGAGCRYAADVEISEQIDKSFLADLDAGDRVSGIIAFDIPTIATIAHLELHESPRSGGVTLTFE